MAPDIVDPRMTSIKPRIRYNTIGGVNGPLVILDNVRLPPESDSPYFCYLPLIWSTWIRSNFPDTMRSSP
jgi:hypothetical protein